MCSLSQLLRSNHARACDPTDTGKTWSEAIRENLNNALKTRREVGDRPFYDLQYSQLLSNPIGAIADIYSHFGLEFVPELELNIKAWLTNNPQHKHGKHEYSTEQFGLKDKTIREQFAFYTNYFQIPI